MPDVNRITTSQVESQERFVTVLEIPPVESPETAVKVAIMAVMKDKK
jgi:hypothetical protein